MIAVKCGYEGCDWEVGNETWMQFYTDDFKYSLLKGFLIDHQVQEHNVPPAMWER